MLLWLVAISIGRAHRDIPRGAVAPSGTKPAELRQCSKGEFHQVITFPALKGANIRMTEIGVEVGEA